MSTNKTTNYGLHQWQPGDTFLRSEINENFAALDGAVATKAAQSGLTALQTDVAGKAEVVFGSYVGNDDAGRVIELGFTPKAVMVMTQDGMLNGTYNFGGITAPGYPCSYSNKGTFLEVTEGGFRVARINGGSYGYSHDPNNRFYTYYYLALR